MAEAVRRAVDVLRNNCTVNHIEGRPCYPCAAASTLEAAYAASQERPASPTAVTEEWKPDSWLQSEIDKTAKSAAKGALGEGNLAWTIEELCASAVRRAALSASAGDAPTREQIKDAITDAALVHFAAASDDFLDDASRRVFALFTARPTEGHTPTETPK
jgi:hypothetical protein